MRTRNSKSLVRILSQGILTFLLAVTLLFSCRKGSVETVSIKNNMAEAAKVLDAKIISGNIKAESNENEIGLNYNNGNKFILIEKIPGTAISMNSIQSAEVITSKYGIILKDIVTNKIILLTNNDPESIKMFEEVKTLFDTNIESAIVFGTTVIKTEKA